MSRRMNSAYTDSSAPITKGMRQPQARNSSGVRKTFCNTSSKTMAINWPPISVVYQTPE